MLSFWISFFCFGFFVASVAYLIARKYKLMAIIDTIWTAGLGLSALVYHTVAELESIRSWAVLLMIFLWSFRLSFHLFRDRVFAGHEDPRYKALAEHWGAQSARNFYFLFLAQIVFIALFLFPVSIAMQNPQPLWAWTDTLAVLIGISAMLGEWIADRQLATSELIPKTKGASARTAFAATPDTQTIFSNGCIGSLTSLLLWVHHWWGSLWSVPLPCSFFFVF